MIYNYINKYRINDRSIILKSSFSLFNLTHCFSLCISARPFVSKLQKRKLLLVWTRFLKKYFQVYKQTVGKFALNLKLTYKVKLTGF